MLRAECLSMSVGPPSGGSFTVGITISAAAGQSEGSAGNFTLPIKCNGARTKTVPSVGSPNVNWSSLFTAVTTLADGKILAAAIGGNTQSITEAMAMIKTLQGNIVTLSAANDALKKG